MQQNQINHWYTRWTWPLTSGSWSERLLRSVRIPRNPPQTIQIWNTDSHALFFLCSFTHGMTKVKRLVENEPRRRFPTIFRMSKTISVFVIFIISLLNCIGCKSSLTRAAFPVTRWPLVEFLQSTALPDPAGFDINTRPWLTETPTLGSGPWGPPQYIQLSFWPVDLPSPVAVRWSISPFSLLTGHPKNRPPAIYLLYDFLRSPWRKTSHAPLHLLQLMRGPVRRGPGRFERGQCVAGLNVDLTSAAEQQEAGTACVRVTCRSLFARGVELTFIRQTLGGLQELYLRQMWRMYDFPWLSVSKVLFRAHIYETSNISAEIFWALKTTYGLNIIHLSIYLSIYLSQHIQK